MSDTRATVEALSPSERLDASVSGRLPADFLAAIDFHGHLCPGLTIGYRAARLAMDRLGVSPGPDEELLGIVETDACGVDAFQFITGCTIGKGNLVYKDYGKEAYTLARRSDGRAVRVVLRPDAFSRDPEHALLRERVMSGRATDAERDEFWQGHIDMAVRFFEEPANEFGTVADVEIDIPPTARLFDSLVCSVCGEAVMEPRARIRDGSPCCIPCATRYSRGWEINE